MTKEDFIKKFPDIKVQQFETETILSKQEIMDIVEQATRSMDMGLVYYEHCGCNITVFTSDKMKAELAKWYLATRLQIRTLEKPELSYLKNI